MGNWETGDGDMGDKGMGNGRDETKAMAVQLSTMAMRGSRDSIRR